MLDRPRWSPDYGQVLSARIILQDRMKKNPIYADLAFEYYRADPIEFINDWCDTVDPRNADQPGRMTTMPLVLFPRQVEMVRFLQACLKNEQSGLIEKSRDMGATWVCCAFSVWLWLFHPGASIGWGSRKADLVHRAGDMDSIFEKMFLIINELPAHLLPIRFDRSKHLAYMRIINPENGASITGESGDEIGRGGRKLIYFKDESAHYERPEKIEAALADNTRVQIDISSVSGLGNVFYRRRKAGFDWEPSVETPTDRTLVFVMDWRDHPHKDKAWYDARRSKASEEGLLHVFAQEVDRNYAASVEGTIIPAEWVESAIDAHKKIKGLSEGGWSAALDVADGGRDRNALVKRRGVTLMYAEEWGERDTGKTARRAVDACSGLGKVDLQYDSISVGAGVKAETNRLRDEKLLPAGIRLISWNAGSGPLFPDDRVVKNDPQSPLNKDFYDNLKAQGWWMLRRRFELTHRALTEKGVEFKPDDLISLPADLPRLRQIQEELSQPTVDKTPRMKLKVDKAPEGTRSPNIADAIMMCYWPVKSGYDPTLSWI